MSRLRLQLGESMQCVERPPLRTRIEPVAQQKETENQQDGVVIDVWIETVLEEESRKERRCRGICKGRAGAERY